ncbi:MAG: DUF349 domain-containing protein, partial [Rubrivivax sp.]
MGTALPTAVLPKPDTAAHLAQATRAEWSARLKAAQADDEALLLVARTAPLLDLRCAAVEALSCEAALKRAERELRGHDSRVHRAAKLRLAGAVAQREARARAMALIDAASALSGEALPAVNHLVTLDRDWQALDASLLSADHVAAFAGLRERIDAALHAQGELQQRVHRWCADARLALAELRRAATEPETDEDQTRRCGVATELRQSRPDVSATVGLDKELQAALDAVLASARQAAAHAEEARLAALAAANSRVAEAELSAVVAPAPAGVGKPDPEQLRQLETQLAQAEAALADGQLGAMQQHLHAVDAALQGLTAARLDESFRARRRVLHAESARLRDWQQWGGAQALDALVAEAIALAEATVAAADPESRPATKLHLKSHAASIQALRQRWQDAGRLGAPAHPSKWQLFDTALHTAYEPVAAQHAAMKVARHDNLRARQALLDALDGVPAQPATSDADGTAAHWRAQLRALGDFKLAWRQLGPVEHTVPAAAKASLLERLRDSIERIEAPIEQARRVAEGQREQLIVRAEALASELARHPAQRDGSQRVRELQAQWQHQARMVPLARSAEAALWARFKAATDTVFTQREAAFQARDAELAAHLAAREALLLRLESIDGDADAAHVQRTLAEIDRAWRQPMQVPDAAASAFEARYRNARAVAAQALATRAQRRWQGQCDTLLAKLALCDEREAALPADAELAHRWAAQDTMPAPWQRALDQRWSGMVVPGPLTERAFEDVLLQLEAGLDLPATLEQQGARRDLKLR